jgi:hypothetical protein
LTPLGIDPATFRFVAYWLPQPLRHRVLFDGSTAIIQIIVAANLLPGGMK